MAADDNSGAVLREVFISYSWDDEQHVRRVLELSNRLRSEGIDCVLDQYEVSPPEGWPRWMDRKIRSAQFVLVVCTETYFRRITGEEDAGTGLGVRWEGGLIYQHMYNAGSENSKFVPVLFRAKDKAFIPTPLQGATYYRVDTPDGYDKLYFRLLNRPKVEKPKLGKPRPLPEREVKTNLAAYLAAPINLPLWDRARWKGAFVGLWPGLPPVFGLAFLNEDPAREIFLQWRKRYGDRDQFEELRVSIIEGEIKGEEPGYSIHIGPDLDNLVKRYQSAGLPVNVESDYLIAISRIHRMNPSPESTNLATFKAAYARAKSYVLAPVVMTPDGRKFKPILQLGILKNTIHFRRVEEIGPDDFDSVVLGSGTVRRPLTEYGKRKTKK